MSLISIISHLSGGYDNSTPVIPPTPDKANPLFIFSGESNSGGRALNSSATVGELAARSSVRILNNTSLLFEDLNIGTNNLIDHAGLESQSTTEHSWELGLANLIEANVFSVSQVHLVKAGQGGSTISQWGDPSTYWTKFKDRVDAALEIDATLFPILFYTHGINDALAGTSTATWKSATIAHFAKIRARYGSTLPIIWPKLMTEFSAYNTAIDEVAAVTDYCWTVETTDLPLLDAYHWNYDGMKTMAKRMIAKLLDNYTV